MDIIYILWLTLKEKIAYMKMRRLLEIFGDAKGVYDANARSYFEAGFLNEEDVRILMDKSLKVAGKEVEKAKRLGIWMLPWTNSLYPASLLNIPDPPLVLYGKGDAGVLKNRASFCIVGTRHSTVYGMSSALGVSQELTLAGMLIVSGVALGIDSAAHRGALRAGGKTVGVMGCGLDVDYPAANRELKNEIVKNGALISEFRLGTPPYGSNFPQRNRILSGMCMGVAVIEAGERSGALITARYAAEQGRDVFALPGNISNPKSGGSNRLIQDGAMLLCDAGEIIEEYIKRYPEYFLPEDTKEMEVLRVAEPPAPSYNTIKCAPDEEKVLRHIGEKPIHIDEICTKCKMEISKLNAVLTMLCIKGKANEHAGRYYSANG